MFWGTRSPVLAEPLVQGARWSAVGGADNDVASVNRYLGQRAGRRARVPGGRRDGAVESDVTHAGALGDPFGSGLRTVWWAYGIGPVKIVFQHSGGETSLSELQSTNARPAPAAARRQRAAVHRGQRATFRWRNNRHMRRWSRQRFKVAGVLNNTARVDVRLGHGPLDVSGSYVFASRLSGVRNLVSPSRASRRRTRTSPSWARAAARAAGGASGRRTT